MKKIIVLSILLLLIIAAGCGGSTTNVNNGNGSSGNNQSLEGKINLAIMPFTNISSNRAINWMNYTFPKIFSSILKYHPQLIVYDDFVLEPYLISYPFNNGIPDGSAWIDSLKILGADYVLTGTIDDNSDNIEITISMWNTQQNSDPIASTTLSGAKSRLGQLIQGSYQELANFLGAEPDRTYENGVESIIANLNTGTEVYTLFGEGLAAYYNDDDGSFDEAIMMFDRATEYDENFILPYISLASIYLTLAENAGNNEEKEEYFQKAFEKISACIEIAPESIDAKLVYSRVNFRLGERETGTEFLNDILESEYNSIDALYSNWLRNGLQLEGEYFDAINQSCPGLIQFNRNLIVKYSMLENLEKAVEHYNIMLSVSPALFMDWYDLSNLYTSLNRWEDAENAANMVIQYSPETAYGYFALGNIHFHSQNYSDAIEQYNTALEKSDIPTDLYLNLGISLRNIGDYQRAISILNEAIANDSYNETAYFERGVSFYENGRPRDAVSDIQQSINLGNRDMEAYKLLGQILIQLGRISEAIATYSSLAQSFPNDLELQLSVANLYAEQNIPARAMIAYERALQLAPGREDIRIEIARNAAAIESYTKAISILEEIVTDNPENIDALKLLAQTYFDAGTSYFGAAMDTYEKLVDLFPANTDYLLNIASIYRQWHQPDMALVIYNQALELEPDNPMIYVALSSCEYELNRDQVAHHHLLQALELSPGDPEVLFQLGTAAMQRGDASTGVIYYNQVLDEEPDHCDTLNALGNLSFDRHNFPDAIRYYTAAVESCPDFHSARYNLGITLGIVGEWEWAENNLSLVYQANPNECEILYLLGYTCERQGKRDDTLFYLHEYFRICPDGPRAGQVEQMIRSMEGAPREPDELDRLFMEDY